MGAIMRGCNPTVTVIVYIKKMYMYHNHAFLIFDSEENP